MRLVLREPSVDDYATVASWVADASACALWAGARFPFPFAARDLPDLIRVAKGASYVLCDENAATLAFGQYRVPRTGAVHLCRIIVAPHARGDGLGKVLCRMLIEEGVRATGATAVTLRVYRNNVAARAVYRSLGFLPVEEGSNPEVLWMRAQAASTPLAEAKGPFTA